MKLCGVVILYNPDEKVNQRIATYQNHLDFLIIVDNSTKSNRRQFDEIINESNTFYLHDGRNGGIAERLNIAVVIARERGFSWILTMDQDSFFEPATLLRYLSCVSSYTKLDRVAVFGIEHDVEHLVTDRDCVLSKTSLLITSGSIVNTGLHATIGGFDENLFIDQVDHEYCFRSIVNGFDVMKVQNVLLQHAIGEVSTHRSFKSFKNSPRALHSPIRLYYMVRNYFYVKDRYEDQFKKEIKAFRQHLFIRLKNNLLYNKNKLLTIRFALKAYRDYKQGRMGQMPA